MGPRRPLSHRQGHKFQTPTQQYKTNNLWLKPSPHTTWNHQWCSRTIFFSIALACENQAPFEKNTIFCVHLGFHETSLRPRNWSRGSSDATLKKDSCLWGYLLTSYTQRVLKRKYANLFKISSPHGRALGIVDGCKDHMEPSGGHGGHGRPWGLGASTGASKGPGIAAVWIRNTTTWFHIWTHFRP
jgi:hypothetical protein